MTATEELADVIALAVHAATQPLLVKIAQLEARPVVTADLEALKVHSADMRERLLLVEHKAAVVGPPGERGPQGEPGPAPDLSVLLEMKAELATLRAEISQLKASPIIGPMGPTGPKGEQGERGEKGEPGRDGKDGAHGLNGKDGADGFNGKDGTPGLNGKDGVDGLNGKDGAPGLDGKNGRDGVDGKDGAVGLHGKDGLGLADALINREGHLVLTLTDGRTKDVGFVLGKDGAPGLDGKDGVPGLNGRDGSDGLNGKDGERGLNGKDGADGLGFDDLSLEFSETRGHFARFSREGMESKEFDLHLPFTAGIWEAGRLYPKGAMVLYRGGSFVALTKTSIRPDEDSTPRQWMLLAARGRDGKPGKDGKNGGDA